jgi:FAD/FMN-containing dehydrogenase
MIPESAVQNFKNALRGPLLVPGETAYEAARTVPNAMIDRRPCLIARCAGAGDVMECVRFAREHELVVSVRGGGHSVAGKAICDSGLMIDLSTMKGIRVDPARSMVRAEPGLTLGEFDRETQAFGLATTMGTVSKTGISGLTLGGGWGHLHAKYGMALDNLTEVDVVTADGRLVTASATENSDLFWGVRGGGGNFGIVTSLHYRLYELGPVFGGAVFYPLGKTKEVLKFFREFAQTLPDELVIQGGAFTLPDGSRVFAVGGCYCGTIAEGEKLLRPLREFGPPVGDLFGTMPYVQVQSMFDPFFPPGRRTYAKANFLRGLSDEAIEVLAEFSGTSPSPYTFGPFLEHWHGAARRVGVTETAFAHRNYDYNFFVWSNWEQASETEENVAWSRACFDAMKSFMASGTYVNYLEEEGDPLARAAYGPNYERLVALKDKFDPGNFFRINHNVRPSAVAV